MTPQTPSSQIDCSTQTNWTDDGIFKIPETPSQKDKKGKEVAIESSENIALRTRSKLSLSDTPLEKIEESFVPPDITTDMYDSECDDEDWKDFLKKFLKPLEAEGGQQEDDDEADPEYNVLADEEVCVVDHEELHEELREDKAVKITKKELNNLVAELFDYSDLFLMDDKPNDSMLNDTTMQINNQNHSQITSINNDSQNNFSEPELLLTYEQRQLLDQQLRQHVQLTTSHFLQTFKHPDFDYMAPIFKDFLITLNEMGKYKKMSAFHIANLPPAMELVENWEKRHDSNESEILAMKQFVKNEIEKS